MDQYIHAATRHVPWNKGKLVGQKAPLKLKDIWAIRVRLQIQNRTRELALFNLAIDSKLRSCDLVKLRVRNVCHGSIVATRSMVMQQRLNGQCNSRSRSRLARHCWRGSELPIVAQTITCFRVASTDRPICLRDSTHESLVAGFVRSVSTQARTEPTRCDVLGHR
jgi:hypothetical protein